MTFFASLIRRLGLSQSEATHYLGVRLDTVKSWSSGRNGVPDGVLSQLHALGVTQRRAADAIAKTMRASRAAKIEAAVRPGEWPCDGAAIVPLVDAWLATDGTRRVEIVEPGSAPATLAAADPKGQG
jgi:hypothetical protein